MALKHTSTSELRPPCNTIGNEKSTRRWLGKGYNGLTTVSEIIRLTQEDDFNLAEID